MIVKQLTILNFKSIRKMMQLPCSKVNIFIGPPNAGKSNIIEALNFFSNGCIFNFNEVFRFKSFSDFFYDSQIDTPLVVDSSKINFYCTRDKNQFSCRYQVFSSGKKEEEFTFQQSIKPQNFPLNIKSPFRFYSFNAKSPYVLNNIERELSEPFGNNLISIIINNKNIREFVRDVFKAHGFRLQIKPVEQEILISKEVGDELFSYPYETISETLRRYIFFMVALETNKDHVLLFDEPETNTFPFYTKQMAERIALDETNQFFFTTHNPYLLASIVEKTPVDKLNIVITYMDRISYETKIYPLHKDQFSDVLDSDIFLNLDKYIETDGATAS